MQNSLVEYFLMECQPFKYTIFRYFLAILFLFKANLFSKDNVKAEIWWNYLEQQLYVYFENVAAFEPLSCLRRTQNRPYSENQPYSDFSKDDEEFKK